MTRSCLAPLLLAGLGLATAAPEAKTIKLSITHPGFESKKAEEHELKLAVDAQGNPLGYSMDVKSVFCSDEKCDVITLSMEWDALGRFVGYKLPDGTKLTKYDHEPFEKADYAKFDELMKNRGSLLADLDIQQVVVKHKDPEKNTKQGTKAKPKDVAGKGDAIQKVDAISGATPSYIQEEVVEGAAYTCYTMWHWANGNTSRQIRAHSQSAGSAEWLTGMLASGKAEETDFALEAITKRKLHEPALQKQAIAAVDSASERGIHHLFNYLTAANPKSEDRYTAYLQLIQSSRGKPRTMLLESLLKGMDAPPLSFFEQTAALLPDFERFYELQLFLSLAEKHQAGSDTFLSAVGKMLAHDNFFFSRRVRTFLKDRTLPGDVKTALEAYEKKHEGKL